MIIKALSILTVFISLWLSPVQAANLNQMPKEVIYLIFPWLDTIDLINMGMVNDRFNFLLSQHKVDVEIPSREKKSLPWFSETIKTHPFIVASIVINIRDGAKWPLKALAGKMLPIVAKNLETLVIYRDQLEDNDPNSFIYINSFNIDLPSLPLLTTLRIEGAVNLTESNIAALKNIETLKHLDYNPDRPLRKEQFIDFLQCKNLSTLSTKFELSDELDEPLLPENLESVKLYCSPHLPEKILTALLKLKKLKTLHLHFVPSSSLTILGNTHSTFFKNLQDIDLTFCKDANNVDPSISEADDFAATFPSKYPDIVIIMKNLPMRSEVIDRRTCIWLQGNIASTKPHS